MKRWPLHKAYFWERAPFFRLLLPLLAGILAYPYMQLSLYYVIAIGFAAFALFMATAWRKQVAGNIQVISFIAMQAAVFFMAWLLCYSSDIRNDQNWFGHKINTADFFEVRIKDMPLEKEHSYKYRVSVLSTMEPGKLSPATGDAFVYIIKERSAPQFNKGDTILVPNKWSPVSNAGNPYEFDYAAFCAYNGIYYQQGLPAGDIVLYNKSSGKELSFPERCHDRCMTLLSRYIKDKQTLGILAAMLAGDNVNLDTETRQAFAATGIVHIVAISGTHIGVLFLMVSGLLWWLRHKRYKWLKYLIALPLAWFYVLMAGAPPSAMRAALMFSLLAIGLALQRNNSSLNTLLATAFILLCAQPMWLHAVGFQLSFIAVLSLIIFYGPVYKLYAAGNWLNKKLWQAIAASIAVEILIAPLVIFYFHLFPALFIVANILALLFMVLILGLGMALILFSLAPLIAQWLGIACTALVSLFTRIVYWLQQFNPESFYYLQIDINELLLLYVFITGLALHVLNKQKAGLYTGLIAACIFAGLLCRDEYIALRQQRLIVYNMGKTVHAELIKGKRYTVLYTDTAAAQQVSYITKAAHTGYHAWRQEPMQTKPELLQVAGKTVLLYKDSMLRPYTGIHADYIVLCRPVPADAALLCNSFHPKCIILPRQSGTQAERWKVACSKLPLCLHYLPEDGAFVLE